MNELEFQHVMAVIATAYKLKTTEQELELWYQNLYDLEYDICQKAVIKIIQENEFAPRIATIRQTYNNIYYGKSLTIADSVYLINQAISKFGSYRIVEALEWIKSKDINTYTVIKAIGFSNYCKSNPEFSNRLIVKMYQEVTDRNNKEMLLERKFAKEIKAIEHNGFKIASTS